MTGNISKSKGFKGDVGPIGPVGPAGPQGEQGVKGDTPSIVFRYDETTGNLYCSSDGVLVDKEYVQSQNLVTKNNVYTKEQVTILLNELEEKLPRKIKINLPASAWVEDADEEYSQVVSIEGVTPYSQIDIQITKEQLAIFREKEISFWVENENGVVTVSCMGQKPTNDYVVQATKTEVVLDE